MLNNSSKFHFDLLQVVACLLDNKKGDFYTIVKYRYGQTPGLKGERIIIGINNAVNFLNDVYTGKNLFDPVLVENLKINPLIKKLGIDMVNFEALKKPGLTLSAIPEGTKLSKESAYLMFETSYVYMALLALPMDRIIEFQTRIFEDCLPYIQLAKKYDNLTGGAPTFVNEGSMRAYNPTLSAYFSRAREIGGIKRFSDPDFESRSEKYINQIGKSWEVKSTDLYLSINSNNNALKFKNKFDSNIVDALIKDGIYYLTEKQLLNYDLEGFALDGGHKNTFSSDGLPKSVLTPLNNLDSNDFIIDSSYQTIFDVNSFSTVSAIYGTHGSRLTDYLSKFNTEDSFRAYRKVIPKILVNSVSEINEVFEGIKSQFKNKDIYFRGQTKSYNLNRSPISNFLLYGNEKIQELSLPTASSRLNFDYDSFSSVLQLQLQGILYSIYDKVKFSVLSSPWPIWGMFSPFKDKDLENKHEKFKRLYYSYEWDLLTMAIGQHYGVPTHGLDITTDIDSALWFATNKFFSYNEDGKKFAWYKNYKWDKSVKIDEYPVIYILATEKGYKRDLEQIEYAGFNALRPIRQNAFLHYGGWGMHTNICAQDVVAALFLTPDGTFNTGITTEWFFPSAKEDDIYRELLDLRDNAEKSGLQNGYEYIVEYKPPK